jgi:hypothetical protein
MTRLWSSPRPRGKRELVFTEQDFIGSLKSLMGLPEPTRAFSSSSNPSHVFLEASELRVGRKKMDNVWLQQIGYSFIYQQSK